MDRAEVRAKAKEYATTALHAVVRDDWAAASTALQAASDELGGRGLGDVIVLLCDTIIGTQNRMAGRPEFFAGPGVARPMWMNTETGRLDTDATAVPPAARWAGQLVAARAAMDLPAYNALLSAIPEDPRERSEHVARLLAGCAHTVKVERGLAS